MPANSVAENVLGTLGAVCWSGQLIPQIWKSWRAKSTEGLSPFLVLFWGLAALPLGIYNILQRLSIPLICQPQLLGFLSLFAWGQCLYYSMGKSRLVATLIAGSVMLIIGGLEVGVVFAVRPSMNTHAIDFFGVFSSIMIAGGLLPQYYEIFKRGEVVGISIPFIAIDCLGGIFSVVSLVFSPKFDIKAGIAYSLVTALDAGIIIAFIILHPLVRKHLKSKKQKYSREMTQNSTTPIWRPTPSMEPQPTGVNVGILAQTKDIHI